MTGFNNGNIPWNGLPNPMQPMPAPPAPVAPAVGEINPVFAEELTKLRAEITAMRNKQAETTPNNKKQLSRAPGFTKADTNLVAVSVIMSSLITYLTSVRQRHVQRGFLAIMGVTSTRQNNRKVFILPDTLRPGESPRRAPDGTELLTPDWSQPSNAGRNDYICTQVAVWTEKAIKVSTILFPEMLHSLSHRRINLRVILTMWLSAKLGSTSAHFARQRKRKMMKVIGPSNKLTMLGTAAISTNIM